MINQGSLQMDQGEFERMIIETHTNSAVTKAQMETFVNTTFPAHEKTDAETAKIAKDAQKKVSRAVWMTGGAIVLMTILEAAHALGIIH